MKTRLMCMILMFAAALTSCAFMKDVEGAWADKKVQSAMKEVNSVADALKAQEGQRIFYRLLINNAEKLSADCEILARAASDSYMKRIAGRMQKQSQDLYFSAKRKNESSTKWAIGEILTTWKILEDYMKPALPPQQPGIRLF